MPATSSGRSLRIDTSPAPRAIGNITAATLRTRRPPPAISVSPSAEWPRGLHSARRNARHADARDEILHRRPTPLEDERAAVHVEPELEIGERGLRRRDDQEGGDPRDDPPPGHRAPAASARTSRSND